MSDHFVVKGYKILSQVEQTPFRRMFRVLHIKSGKEVFLTLIELKPGRVMDLLRKRSEQSTQLKLKNLVSAIDYGEFKSGFYYTQEAVATLPLQRVLDEISEEDKRHYFIVRYFMQVLDVVEYVHRAKTTHRDLTTSSLRLGEKSQLLLEGFINARPKMEQRSVVTMVELPYLAPEILLGKPVDKKTDLYSLGVIFFELVTGHLPYPSNFAKIEDAKRGAIPSFKLKSNKNTDLFEKFILRSLGPRNTRYKNCREWLNELELFYKKRPFSLKVTDFSNSIKTMFSHSI